MRRLLKAYTRRFVCLWVTGVVVFLVFSFPDIFTSRPSVTDIPHPRIYHRHLKPGSLSEERRARRSNREIASSNKYDAKTSEEYFKLRETKVNKLDAEFLITNRDFCERSNPYLLTVVPSIPTHSSVRAAIRKTYGSYINHTDINGTVRVLFFFGRGQNDAIDKMIQEESKVFKDIVQADFKESYGNLTIKVMVILKWVATFCGDIDFMLKSDEDVFVNIPTLISRLQNHSYGIEGSVLGYINSDSSVRRLGKWAVQKSQFPLPTYPTYASGNSYVISGNIIPRMFMVSEYIPYMPIEDVFVSGILAKIVGAKHVSLEGFTHWKERAPDPCSFVKKNSISATKVTIQLMFELWDALTSYEQKCINTGTELELA